MLNDLIKAVAKKANIPESIAKVAVDTVLKSLKDKLPPAASNSLNALLGSGSAAGSAKSSKSSKNNNPLGDFGNIAGTLGGLLGKK